jgi:hydroxymethylglutaryl-CoA synthase
MAANAAKPLIQNDEKNSIRLLLFATESGVDQSKAAGLWVHHLLSLSPSCRVVELKQACYSGTCALQLALSYLHMNPQEKVLLITSDNARYGLEAPGEPTQGCAAVAMLLSIDPRLLVIEPHQGIVAEHVMDFFRPNYLKEAIVDGKFSTKAYLQILMECWKEYMQKSSRSFLDHDRFCYHIPFTRMAEKAHERLSKASESSFSSQAIESSLIYSRHVGNAYTASLYLGLISLLEHDKEDLSGKRIGFFSYGSGCVGEFFSGIIQKGYEKNLFKDTHNKILSTRKSLSYEEYVSFFNHALPEDGTDYITPIVSSSPFRLHGIKNHERLYTQII